MVWGNVWLLNFRPLLLQDPCAIVDEFGSAIGMITMEDILEEVVGEIDVGYDFDEYSPRKRHRLEEVSPGVYLMDSRVPISEANEVLGLSLSDREAHTVGGLVTARLRRIPVQGDNIEEAGFRITVDEASDRAVVRLRVESVIVALSGQHPR